LQGFGVGWQGQAVATGIVAPDRVLAASLGFSVIYGQVNNNGYASQNSFILIGIQTPTISYNINKIR
jgi:hypothetical protein